MKPLALLVAATLALACGGTPSAPTPEPVPVEQLPEPQKPAAQEDRVAAFQAAKAEKETQKKTYAYQLARVQNDIDGALKVAAKNPRSWLGLDRAANAYLAKARLTGDYADYAK